MKAFIFLQIMPQGADAAIKISNYEHNREHLSVVRKLIFQLIKMIFSILSNLTFGGIPYRTINHTYFYEEIRTSLDTCISKWSASSLITVRVFLHPVRILVCDLFSTSRNSGQDPDGEIENSGKSMGKAGYRTSVTFKLQFLTLAIYQWQWLRLSKYATMKKCGKWKRLLDSSGQKL